MKHVGGGVNDLNVTLLAKILRNFNIGCEDHSEERESGDRRQHRASSHLEDARNIAAEYARLSGEEWTSLDMGSLL